MSWKYPCRRHRDISLSFSSLAEATWSIPPCSILIKRTVARNWIVQMAIFIVWPTNASTPWGPIFSRLATGQCLFSGWTFHQLVTPRGGCSYTLVRAQKPMSDSFWTSCLHLPSFTSQQNDHWRRYFDTLVAIARGIHSFVFQNQKERARYGDS